MIKYKKQEIIILSCVFVIAICIGLYSKLFGFEKLEWDKKYEELSYEYINQGQLKLGVKFSDKDKAKDIKYSTTCAK